MKSTAHEGRRRASPQTRLASKTQDQRMINEVVDGTGMSPREANVVVDVIREVYFATPGNAPLRHGQILDTCVSASAGASIALRDRPMTSVILSLIDCGDDLLTDADQRLPWNFRMRFVTATRLIA